MLYRKIKTVLQYFNSFRFGSIAFFRKIFFSYHDKSLYFFLLSLRSNLLKKRNSNYLTEFKIFPKYPKKMYPRQSNIKELSIIIHGEINNREFIQESINWYRSCGIKNIIVATGDNIDHFNNAETIVIAQNSIKEKSKENNDILEINAALKTISKNNIILKTNSDQRIFNELAISALPYIHKNYHSKFTKSGTRLGVLSSNSKISEINSISDFLYVGTFEQISNIYSMDLIHKEKLNNNKKLINQIDSKFNILTEFYPSQFFFNSFRKNCLIKDMSENKIVSKSEYLKCLANYIDIITECLYVLDPIELDILSLSGNLEEDLNFLHNKENLLPSLNLTRLNWMSLTCDSDYKNKIISFLSNKIKSI